MTETVGDRFQGAEYAPVEELIHLISDGCFNTAALNKYEATHELDKACREALRQMGNDRFDGRKTCAAIMSRAMEILRLRHGLNAPRGWLPVLKELRAQAGPATAPKLVPPPKLTIAPAEVLTNTLSAFGEYRDRLQPFNDPLVEVAHYEGVPGNWRDAVRFLDCVIDGNVPHEQLAPLIAVRDEIRTRVPA